MHITKTSLWLRLVLLCLIVFSFVLSGQAQGPKVVISQVYGAGGNTGASYQNDFIELYNSGDAAQDLSGWSVQYASATGSSWSVTQLSGSIEKGHYLLIKEGGGSNGVALPAADVTGSISMAAGAGKVALVNGITALTGTCPTAGDFVGYGSTANCFEGSGATPAPNATMSVFRANGGCTDTNNNAADFATAAVAPRNSSNTFTCTGPPPPLPPSAVGNANPWSVDFGTTSLLTVTVTPGSNPISTGITVASDLSAIGGSAAQALYDDGTNGDVTAGDGVFSYLATVTNDTTAGAKTLSVSVTDAQSRTASTNISLTVTAPVTVTPIHTLRRDVASYLALVPPVVRTTGVVTHVRANGFYLQEPNGSMYDGINSLGIFIYTNSPPVSPAVVGNEVQVTGTLKQYPAAATPTQLEISSPALRLLTTGNVLPAAIEITPNTTDSQYLQFEKYAGMRVKLADTWVTGPTDGGAFYAEQAIHTRPFREPGVLQGLTLPDNAGANVPRYDGNPEVVRVDMSGCANQAVFSVGDTSGDLLGVIDYVAAYSINTCATGTTSKHAQALSAANPNEFTVASYNMLNFTGSNPQMTKTAMEIVDILRMPDIIGFEEVATTAAAQGLVEQVNAYALSKGLTVPNYRLEMGDISGTQNVGFLYRGDRVTKVSSAVLGDTSPMAAPCSSFSLWDRRPFQLDATITTPYNQQFPVTILVNHLRSLISVDQNTPTGYCARLKRSLEAEALAQILGGLQRQGTSAITIGDMNAFEFNDGYVDVMGALTGNPAPPDQVTLASTDWIDPNLIDLVQSLPDRVLYTYVENGSSQVLDHIVVDSTLAALPHHVEVAHANSEFPYSYTSDASRPERNSDHDQPVVYITFPKPMLTVLVDSVSKVYGDENPTFTGSISGMKDSDTFTLSFSTDATATSDAGKYPIKATVNDPEGKLADYSVTNTDGTLTVTEAPLIVTTADAARLYGAQDPAFTGTIDGLRNSDDITATYASTATASSVVGTYPIRATLVDHNNKLGNYKVTNTDGTLTVSKAALRLSAQNATRPYGATNPTFTGVITGALATDGISATYTTTATASSPVGTYDIVPAVVDPNQRIDNYTVTLVNGKLTVDQASTAVSLEASATPVVFGTPVTFTATLSGATGSVTFKDGSATLGTATFNGSGLATYTDSLLTVGVHSIAAVYAGDANFVGSTSNAVSVVVTAFPPPVITSLSQGSAKAGAAGFTLSIYGSNFLANSSVNWNGAARSTTYVSPTELRASILAADLATVGNATITVANTTPSAAASNGFKFAIDTAAGTSGSVTVTGVANVTVTHGLSTTVSFAFTGASSDAKATAECFNMPAGATCTYNDSTKVVTITTAASTPAGTYPVTVVFTITNTITTAMRTIGRAMSWSFALLPFGFMLMGKGSQLKRRSLIALALLVLALSLAGCGSSTTTAPPTRQVVVQSSAAIDVVVN